MDYIKQRWFLLLVLVVFIICKIPHLYYQYYWDESWVYAPAAMAMYRHGPSLLPNAIPVDLSRGHPLLFHVLFAGWANVFGPTHFSFHCCALFISVLLIVFVYEAALKLFDQRVAMIAILLIVFDLVFFVESAFVLPDILIALFVISAIYFYVKEKYVIAALSLTLLFYTKESGMVLGLVLGADALRTMFKKNTALKTRLSGLASVVIPVLLIGLFFIIQKHTLGWYFNPVHTGMMDFDFGRTIFYLKCGLSFLFQEHYKGCYFLLAGILAIVVAIQKKNAGYAILLLPAVIIYFLNIGAHYTEFVYTLILLLFVVSVWAVLRPLVKSPGTAACRFIVISAVFLVVYIYFSSVNFFEKRYLVPAMVLSMFLAAAVFDHYILSQFPKLLYPIVLAFMGIGMYSFKTEYDLEKDGEGEFGAFSRMKVEQKVVDYFENNNLYDKKISGGHQDIIRLTNPDAGFLSSGKTFNNAVEHAFDRNAEYVIFQSIEYDSTAYNQIKQDTNFHVAYRVSVGVGITWAEVFVKNYGK